MEGNYPTNVDRLKVFFQQMSLKLIDNSTYRLVTFPLVKIFTRFIPLLLTVIRNVANQRNLFS